MTEGTEGKSLRICHWKHQFDLNNLNIWGDVSSSTSTFCDYLAAACKQQSDFS